MSGTQFIQTAEIKEKYDGKYANLEPWNRKFESRLQQRNPMGMSILKGDIKVGKKLTPVGMVYKQIAPVLTTLVLITRFICEIPEVTRDEWKAQGDGHQRAVEILENESYNMETKLYYLNELTKTPKIEPKSDESSDENSDSETSKTITPNARTPENEFIIRGDNEQKADLFVTKEEQLKAEITQQLKSIYKSRSNTYVHIDIYIFIIMPSLKRPAASTTTGDGANNTSKRQRRINYLTSNKTDEIKTAYKKAMEILLLFAPTYAGTETEKYIVIQFMKLTSNKNNYFHAHTDSKDIDVQYLFSVGPGTCDTVIYDEDGNEKKPVQYHERIFCMDGRVRHKLDTSNLSGTRYSVVYFKLSDTKN
jgi:hypothetical protein